MNVPDSTDPPPASFQVTVRFEGRPKELPDARVYALDAGGQVLASQTLSQGRAELRIPECSLSGISLAIGPNQRDGGRIAPIWPPLFQTDWEFEPGVSQYVLRSVPENIWRWWLLNSLHKSLWPERTRRFKLF